MTRSMSEYESALRLLPLTFLLLLLLLLLRMVLVAYAGPVRPAAALRDSVLCLPTDIHSLFVNKPSSSSSSSSSSQLQA